MIFHLINNIQFYKKKLESSSLFAFVDPFKFKLSACNFLFDLQASRLPNQRRVLVTVRRIVISSKFDKADPLSYFWLIL